MLRDVPKPHELSSVLLGKYLCDSKLVQSYMSSLAFLTGNFSQIDSIPADLYNHTMYAYSSFFDGYVPADFKPLTMESLMLLAPGDPSYDDVVNIIKLIGLATEIEAFGPIGSILGAVGGITEDVLNTINQARLLQCMDKESALERAKLYQEASDLSMKAVGYTMEQLLTADPAKQVAILTGTAGLSVADDIANCAAEIILPIALTAATGGAAAPVLAVIDTVTATADIALNTSDIPTVINNMTYAADMVYETYELYDKAYKAYEADPSEANLKKAITAYETYQHAIADSYSAVDATVNNLTDSNLGKKLNLDENEAFDKAAKASENHRQLANTMNYTYDQYAGK